MIPLFVNESPTNYQDTANRTLMMEALKEVRGQFGHRYPLIIGPGEVMTDDVITSVNPSNPQQVLGYVAKATPGHVDGVLEIATRAFDMWRWLSFEERARFLLKAAAIMRREKHQLSAWMCYEAGKSWVEADADTAEAIDFLEYYAREAIRLGQGQCVTVIPGEDSALTYAPLGVGVVIPPWNFPLAILTGMTSAALVSGNTVIVKPASNTPIIAYQLMRILRRAGVPDGVVNYLPGSGSEIGDALVNHAGTRFVNFTGSREVGVRIYERAARVHPGQRWLKRVICEMGGKDAIVVDADADIDEAAAQIVASAFGYSGQKCSACSRAILHDVVYEAVAKKIVERCQALKIGPADCETTQIGPVIDAIAERKILEYIRIGRGEGTILCGGNKVEGNGYFIEPTVFGDVTRNAIIAQEEIFGPVLVLIRAKDFGEAIDIANDTEYGLTGGVFSNNRTHLEYARTHFHVGNLYLNRKCTGALVGVHPFGGFNMSGTDSKAGGHDYLLLFTQAKSIAERF